MRALEHGLEMDMVSLLGPQCEGTCRQTTQQNSRSDRSIIPRTSDHTSPTLCGFIIGDRWDKTVAGRLEEACLKSETRNPCNQTPVYGHHCTHCIKGNQEADVLADERVGCG